MIRMGEAPQILVTGATGFIGTHLVGKLAEEGRPMRCLVRGSSLEVARDHLSRFGAELVYRISRTRARLAPRPRASRRCSISGAAGRCR